MNTIINREIERTPSVPKDLNKETIEALTELCFRKNDDKFPQLDLIFIFGTAISFDKLKASLEFVLRSTYTKSILITGGVVKYPDSGNSLHSESELIYKSIKDIIPQGTNLLIKESQNTLENVLFGLKLISHPVNHLCAITKSLHVGRTFLTLKKQLSKTCLLQRTYDPFYSTIFQDCNAESWYKYPEFIARVWGELLRIKRYGEKGDIAY